MRRLAPFVCAVGLLLAAAGGARADVKPIGGSTGPGIGVRVPGSPGGPGGSEGGGGRNCTYVHYPDANPGDYDPKFKTGKWEFWWWECDGMVGEGWFPAGQPMVDAGTLAREAYKFLALPLPGIRTSPAADRNQLVNLETWLWLERSTWGARDATASVPGLAATVTATAVSVTWTMGDGQVVVCPNPGTPYDLARSPESQRTSCSHTYRRSSAGEPGQRFPVSATTTWRIAWTATNGESGVLPDLERTSVTSLRVAEAQAIN